MSRWPWAAAAVGAITLPVGLLSYMYRRPLPKVSGQTTVAGLEDAVEIIHDGWGVPHVYARSLPDLLFAQGYVHAQDRLWQMELNRRIGHGRLAEIFGEVAFSTDSFLRTIGLSRAAHASLACLDAETRDGLEAYARGVNACISEGRLPLEFTLLRLRPEPWQAVDSLAWAKMMAWGLSANWDTEILHAAFISKLGAERAAALHPEYPAGNPVVMPEQVAMQTITSILEQFKMAEDWLPVRGVTGMSNNWVVDGAKSITGRPLLANDPHLTLQMPSIWYENHLSAPGFEATGVSLPGIPCVVIGHNADVAWGMTASTPDVQDLYIEKPHPEDRGLFAYQDGWERAKILREEIKVKGEASPRVLEVTVTRHGPIINRLLPAGASGSVEPLALRWTGHDPSRAARGVMELNRARDWKQFCAALSDWDEPSQSFVYADRAGNIGLYVAGKVPIRAKGLGVVPVPGWTGEYEWTGYIPHEEMPHSLNPAQHYVATANNRLVGEEYPHFLGMESMNGFRARRIAELLTAKEKLSAGDFARIQVDRYCEPARVFCELLTGLSEGILADPSLAGREQAARAIEMLKAWDHHLTAESVAGSIYELTQHYAMRRVFEPWLGELTDHYLGVGFQPLLWPMIALLMDNSCLVLHRMLSADERDWFKDERGNPTTREALLALALRDAIDYLRQEVGQDTSKWQWGRIHQVSFGHPMGAKKPLDRVFDRGPYPYGGDFHTVWQASYPPILPIDPKSTVSASWRQIIDVGDWDASHAVHTTGQSGHPASKHYDDFAPLWLRGEYHPMLWTREKVESHAKSRLTLRP